MFVVSVGLMWIWGAQKSTDAMEMFEGEERKQGPVGKLSQGLAVLSCRRTCDGLSCSQPAAEERKPENSLKSLIDP